MISNNDFPLLEFKNVSKSFGPIDVLEKVSFSIRPGEVVGLLGDNGAGKSTLIKLITGFYQPTSGTMFWQGKKILFHKEKGPQQARTLGIEAVYQDLGLVNGLSITRNFFLGRELKRKFFGFPFLAHSKMAQVTAIRLKDIGISRPLRPKDPVTFLSGGERQAIAIGRARHFGAKLLILDEPTSALSLNQTEQVLSYVEMAAKSGLAVIFITHTLNHIHETCDRLIVLFRGQIVGDHESKEIDQSQLSSLITQGALKDSGLRRPAVQKT